MPERDDGGECGLDKKEPGDTRTANLIMALIIGFAGIVFISFFVHWYEVVVLHNASARQIIVNALTPCVLFMILLVVAIVNPLLRLLSEKLVLRTRELTLILCLWFLSGALSHMGHVPATLAAIATVNSPAMDTPSIERTGFKGYLKQSIFLPANAARGYFDGMSPDGATRIRLWRRATLFVPEDFRDLPDLAENLMTQTNSLAQYLRAELSEPTLAGLRDPHGHESLPQNLANDLNRIVAAGPLPISRDEAPSLPGTSQEMANRRALSNHYSSSISGFPPYVPWGDWVGPLTFWIPFLLITTAFSISLVKVVHRQWSKHELLTYPIAAVSGLLVEKEDDRPLPAIFYNRVFWAGFALAAFIYILSGLKAYFPLMVAVPTKFAHYEIIKEFHFLGTYCGKEAYAFFRGFFYPSVVCLIVFLPAELSLTCWLGWMLLVLGTGLYYQITGQVISNEETQTIRYGMYIAMAVSIAAVGWREYLNVFRCALFLGKPKDDGIRKASRACRVFILSFISLWYLFTAAGLDWFISFVLVGAFALIVLLIARMTAETGIPWLVNFAGSVSALPMKLLGAAALGPQALAVIATMGFTLDFATGNSVVAQATTCDKLNEGNKSWLRGAGFNLVLAIGICLSVCATTFFTLRDNYSFGFRQERLSNTLQRARVNPATREISRLQVENRLEVASRTSGLAKLKLCKVEPGFWRFLIMGAALVGICAFMRLRFTWWPFHPLPLLFINTWAMSRLYFSVFLGWLIKLTILKIWGGKTFSKSKPFFVGVIVGQVSIYGLFVTIGAIYHLIMDAAPELFRGVYY